MKAKTILIIVVCMIMAMSLGVLWIIYGIDIALVCIVLVYGYLLSVIAKIKI